MSGSGKATIAGIRTKVGQNSTALTPAGSLAYKHPLVDKINIKLVKSDYLQCAPFLINKAVRLTLIDLTDDAGNMRAPPSTHARDAVIGPLRSRRGCKTCKARRVKCGQEKPSCLRCSKTGRKCEYEGPNLGTFSSTPATLSILDKPLSSAPDTVWKERRAFAYYFQHIALFIGGGLEVDFWSTIVPQICRSEPAVWDAIISLSTLFESPEPCPDIAFLRQRDVLLLNQYHRDAISWYSRSMSQVRQRLERGDGDVLVGLVSCILFMCIEGFQGGAAQATRLYCQGVQLIVTLRGQIASGAVSSSKAAWLEDIIVPIFIRLGATALNFSTVPVGALLPDVQHVLTQGFTSLKSAREAIVLLHTETQLFQRICLPHLLKSNGFQPPPELVNQRLALFGRLKVWHAAFTELMETLRMKGALSPQQISTGALLLAYHEMLYVMIGTSTSQLETANDAYLLQFQNIVDQSKFALGASARSDGSQPPLTLELGISIPLWFTSLKCREPKLRQTALSLAEHPISIPADRLQSLGQLDSADDPAWVRDPGDASAILALPEYAVQLGCLNFLRQLGYRSDDNFTHLPSFQGENSLVWDRAYQCIERLRHAIMCWGDVGAVTLYYNGETTSETELFRDVSFDFGTLHYCRNFDSINQWTKENGVGAATMNNLWWGGSYGI
ncbi:transcriptional regulator family: Fungal Specific TF [Aspergillus niger]|nr:transcriptional regulator family: Fungal Specific TF [Aspergillus niger]